MHWLLNIERALLHQQHGVLKKGGGWYVPVKHKRTPHLQKKWFTNFEITGSQNWWKPKANLFGECPPQLARAAVFLRLIQGACGPLKEGPVQVHYWLSQKLPEQVGPSTLRVLEHRAGSQLALPGKSSPHLHLVDRNSKRAVLRRLLILVVKAK